MWTRFTSAFLLSFCVSWGALAQTNPTGSPVLNQAQQAAALAQGSLFTPTRGVYIGDATACTVSFYFAGNSSYVTLTNLQPGAVYPFQVNKIGSSATTCTSIIGLW